MATVFVLGGGWVNRREKLEAQRADGSLAYVCVLHMLCGTPTYMSTTPAPYAYSRLPCSQSSESICCDALCAALHTPPPFSFLQWVGTNATGRIDHRGERSAAFALLLITVYVLLSLHAVLLNENREAIMRNSSLTHRQLQTGYGVQSEYRSRTQEATHEKKRVLT